MSRLLARKIKASGYKPDLIIAIGRGGYVPGRLVSDFLLFSDLTSIKVEHYLRGAEMKAEARIRFPLSVDISGKKVLIVDDVTDTGDTLKLSIGYVQSLNASEIRTAVLQHKTCSSFVPDFYGQKIIRWRWIIYPWARYEDLAGFTKRILEDGALDVSRIIYELKDRHGLEVGEKEILEILHDLAERKEIEKTEVDNLVKWQVRMK
ncbi:phosphoribosyltransferase [Methanosarcina mazei]|uniref:Phosphoribosyltransferase n=1 Tax=Methanosarcina mazei TaxID=2209 RepID=A0A6C0VKH6_METMZ|nr:phosphoribosyltransferase [Methanosarcina mazei]QIB90783.1 phosphoribosyltransferase [Methanosarcina mazei]TAH69712.1 MAG: phosphoribosyltransferase [Methanosarcina mazei]WIM45075.1 phosphoribosyltransferase [Methanosarcina mazei]WIM48495.1 phosphoribosyltransferase [Methanosarcina mazei]